MENDGFRPLPNVEEHCFACGRKNPHGLKMRFETDGERVRGAVRVPEHLRGWQNLVHGGVLATILDETMAWSAISLLQRFILTREMTVRYRKPVPVGSDLVVTGYPDRRSDDRNVTMAAEIVDGDGDVCCTGRGEFVLFTEEEFAKMDILPALQLREMKRIFAGGEGLPVADCGNRNGMEER